MLRILMAIGLISLALACAQKDAGKGLVKLSSRNTGAEKIPLLNEPASDSTFYIGYVDYFPETREFYTLLFYRDGREYPDEDLLESRLDSVIVLDDDWGRERLPTAEAGKLLVLTGLDTLMIFNRRHQQVCKCPMTRVEYLWNGLENYFIATFKSPADFKGQTEELYGISADFPKDHFNSFSSEEINDPQFNDLLIRKLNVSTTQDWQMRHYRIAEHETTYSVISSYSMDTNEMQSYLTSFENNKVRILNQELDNFHFLNILPLPVHMNGKPLLLISAGYPSSDVLWDYLAGFDGKRYEAIEYNRVHLKSIIRPWPAVLSQAERTY